MKVRGFAIGLVLVALCAATEARAQPSDTAADASSAALPLKLELGDSKLDAETVRKAIELELKRPVVLADIAADAPGLTVVARKHGSVTVTYRPTTGVARARSIGIPNDGARGAEVIALLSGNLSRDEAAELLADLEANSATPAAEVADAEATTEAAANESEPKPAAGPKPDAAETRPPPSPKPAQRSAPPPLLKTPLPAINLSLAAPLTLYPSSERRIFLGEFGLFYSHVGELRGIGVNVFVLRTERDARGISVATFYNYTGGRVRGISVSAIANRRQELRGVEVSGLLNLGASDTQGVSVAGLLNLGQRLEGVQTAGLFNRSADVEGAQVAGLFNRGKEIRGAQVAALFDWADGMRGVQTAGVFNRAGKVEGVQVAAAANVADSLSGLQIGVVNVAGDVHGLQLGVVNVAKHVDGTSIGLVSVAENGRAQAVLWGSTAQPVNVAAKFTVGPIYTQAGLGYAPGDRTYTYELGMGAHFPFGRFFVEPGVHYSEMRATSHPFDHELIEYGHYRVAAGVGLGRASPFAGVGVLQRFVHTSDAPASVPVKVELFGGVAFF